MTPLLLFDERPNLVALDVADRKVAKFSVQKLSAEISEPNKMGDDGSILECS